MSDKYVKRVWLNPANHSDCGWMKVSCEHGSKGDWVDAEITIADCSRIITLDLDYNKITKRRRLKKLDTIIALLTELREVME